MLFSNEEFISICIESAMDINTIQSKIKSSFPDSRQSAPYKIRQRIANLQSKGLLPLDSGNNVSFGQILKSSSTLYDSDGNIKLQWVKSDQSKDDQLEAIKIAIEELAHLLPSLPVIDAPVTALNGKSITTYISNDVHLGALMWDQESGTNWNIDIAVETLKASYDYLFSVTPNSEEAIVVDLGDLSEVNDYKNMTPNSGNILAVDSRYPKILRAGYESLIYAITKALEKHKTVYFYNIAGNHDISYGDAIREVIRMHYINNPRVIVDDTPRAIKYHQHGTTLLGFAHGDGLKMSAAGETMAHDCSDIFSSTINRYFHFGHTHKDAVLDSRICKSESHRNLAPLNAWAYHKGFRGPVGSMKAITYHSDYGEISRSVFNVGMLNA